MKGGLITIALALAVLPALGGEGEKPFTLKVQDKQATLINGALRASVGPGSINAGFAGPFGNFGGYGLNLPPEQITVLADTDAEKSVAMQAQDGPCRITLTLTAVKDSPAIELQAARQNLSEYAVLRHFYYRLVGFKFPYYYDANGWQYAGAPQLPASAWMFFPSANTNGGYGLIQLNPGGSKITTIWPRGDWQAVGPYFSPDGPRMLPAGATATIGFRIFPANSQEQTAALAGQAAAAAD